MTPEERITQLQNNLPEMRDSFEGWMTANALISIAEQLRRIANVLESWDAAKNETGGSYVRTGAMQ